MSSSGNKEARPCVCHSLAAVSGVLEAQCETAVELGKHGGTLPGEGTLGVVIGQALL